jgi:hypothetical protein
LLVKLGLASRINHNGKEDYPHFDRMIIGSNAAMAAKRHELETAFAVGGPKRLLEGIFEEKDVENICMLRSS